MTSLASLEGFRLKKQMPGVIPLKECGVEAANGFMVIKLVR
jgi:hypothetical protein